MYFSKLKQAEGTRQQTDRFGGYWPEDTAGAHQFYEMRNLCADAYPYLMPRGRRTKVYEGDSPGGIHGGEKLLYVDGTTLYYNGAACGQVAAGEKQFVQMGAQVLILPDKLVFDTQNQQLKAVEAQFSTVGAVDISLCAWDGSDLGEITVSATAPEEPADGMLWLDTSASPQRLCQYAAASLCWVVRSDTAIRIAAAGIGALFAAGDGISVSGCANEALNGSHILLDAAQDSIRLEGLLAERFSQTAALTVRRSMPDLDFAVELNNRIWGCSSAAREIYACKLGDPFNWNCFGGTAADSYAVSVGSPGAFTGAAVYQGAALFFKEDCLHKVLGSKPANFQLTWAPIEGVRTGAHRTLKLAGGYLFYQAADGVRVYGSSGTTLLSGRWGVAPAGCAGAFSGKYYLYLPGRGLLVYDLASGLWHREDETEVAGFACCGSTLFAQLANGEIWRLAGEAVAGQEEGSISWQAESGAFPAALSGGSYVSGLTLRVLLEAGSTLAVDLCYDDSGEYTQVYAIAGGGKKTYRLPILPRLAETVRIRLRGQGDMRVYGLTRRVREV